MHLLGDGERLAVGPLVDLVGGEALGSIRLVRLQHAQGDIDDHVGRAVHVDGDQGQVIFRRDGRKGSSTGCACLAVWALRTPLAAAARGVGMATPKPLRGGKSCTRGWVRYKENGRLSDLNTKRHAYLDRRFALAIF